MTAIDNLMLSSEEAKQQFIVGGGVAFSVNALGANNEVRRAGGQMQRAYTLFSPPFSHRLYNCAPCSC